MSQPGGPSVAEAWVGPGFYKLGYVTTSVETAVEEWSDRLGVEKFVQFSPSFEARSSDGRTGHAQLRCAFSAGRHHTIELMEPVSGLVDLWAAPLIGHTGFALTFHHTGLVVDDLSQLKAMLADAGIVPVLEAAIEPGIKFAYYRPPLMGHHVEHIEYTGDAGAFLAGVRRGSQLAAGGRETP